MTTADEETNKSKSETTPSSGEQIQEKQKSAGFIESTSFKPTWLETGPLSPDMLPPELIEQAKAEAEADEGFSDDLLSQLAELERLYLEAEADQGNSFAAGESIADMEVLSAIMEKINEPDMDAEATAEEETAVEEETVVEATDVMVEDDLPANPQEITSTMESEPVMITEDDVVEEIISPVELPDEEVGEVIVEEFEAIAAEPLEADIAIEAPEVEPVKEVPVAPAQPAPRKQKPKRKHPLFDNRARTLLILGLILLGLAALTYFINPFARLALSTARMARPVSSSTLADPAGAETGWCVTGSFLNAGDASPRMQDSGKQGDIVADDGVFALQLETIAPGTYQWQVVGCEQSDLVYPAAASWIEVEATGQPVTFMFDSEERDEPLFFPIPYTVSAFDSVNDFQVVGSFQDWNPDDPSGVLQHLGGGVYQQVRRISRPGTYEAYIISGDAGQAIDAYGRTSEPIPFSFETNRRSEAVVFLLDTNRGRASVLYGMPWWATQLAYGTGFRILSLLLGLGGLLLLAWMLLRMIMMANEKNWLEAGCPQCGHHELMRISRTSRDRMLNSLGIPAYRYQCRHCTWTGTRLSEDGATVSPGDNRADRSLNPLGGLRRIRFRQV
ncbi:MAG: choice-of-anchor X domain-containing protein [Chloroflexota bacterium]